MTGSGTLSFRDLLEQAASDPAWVPSISAELDEEIAAALPEFAKESGLAELLQRSTRANVQLVIDMITSGADPASAQPPPEAMDYAREFVRRGVSVDALLRIYFVGHATFFRRWVGQLQSQVTDPAELATATTESADWTFAYIQAVTGGLVERYAEERERWVRSSAAVKLQVVDSILAGEPLDALEAGRRLGYDLDRGHLAFVVWSDAAERSADDHLATLERAASDLARNVRPGGLLLVPRGPLRMAGWITLRGETDDQALARLRLDAREHPGVRAAAGSCAAGLTGFAASHAEALQAQRVAELAGRRPGTVTAYREVALAALASTDLEHARRFVHSQLGPLAADTDTARRLAATLQVYLEESSSPRRTAARLGVHENTVVKRIRSVREQLGEPVEGRVPELLVALKLAPLVMMAG